MLMKKGQNKDIEKLIKAFFKINICVFGYTAPNEDSNIQKNTRNIKPLIKNIVCLIIKFFFSCWDTESACDKVNWLLI